MTQGERVKKVRKTRQLTLEKFGEKIGLKKNTMSAIETGRNSLTEANIKSICREFEVMKFGFEPVKAETITCSRK